MSKASSPATPPVEVDAKHIETLAAVLAAGLVVGSDIETIDCLARGLSMARTLVLMNRSTDTGEEEG